MTVPPREAETCPVCATPGGRPIYTKAQDPITLDSFQIVECASCAVVYTTPRPSTLDRYYPMKYRSYGRLVTSVLSALYGMRVSRWARLKPTGGSVLEIGCGPGLMLAAFHRRGWRVLGIERDKLVADIARHDLGIEIVATPVEALPADVQFDLIIMFQVLEHISEPLALLRECAKRLALGGRIIMNVPNFSSWQSRFAGSKWLHLDVPRHLVHFTPQTLAETLKRAGLKTAEVRFASLEHDPYGWVESTMNKLTRRPNILTRFLMGLEPFGPAVILSCVLGLTFVPPALVLSLVSWPARRGALMEVTATRTVPSEK